jgi:hypothetical protein
MMDIANISVIRSILATRSLRGTSQRVRGPRMASEWATEARLPMKRFARQEIADEALPLAFSCGFYTISELICQLCNYHLEHSGRLKSPETRTADQACACPTPCA